MENVADNILAKMNKRVDAVAKRLSNQYKGVKPFDAREIKPEDQLFWYEQLAPADMDFLIEKYGRDAINELIFSMEQLKARRSKNA